MRTSTTLLDGLADPQNHAAWRRFYASYTPLLFSYARRLGLTDADAEDLVADTLKTFVELYGAGRYDRNRARLKSWLGGIAQKKALKLLGRRRSEPTHGNQPSTTTEPTQVVDHGAAFEREWQLERLDQALARLRREVDPTTYQAFDLYALNDWPPAQVASFLNVSRNVVYISKTRTLRRLREIVQAIAEEEGD